MIRILLILPSSTYRAGAFMKAASELNLEIIVGSNHKQVLSSVVRNKMLFLPLWDEKRSVRKIQDLAEKMPIDHVIGVDEQSVVIAALANEALNLPDNSSESVRATRDKYLMRKRLEENGVHTPEFYLINFSTDHEAITRKLTYPLVLKPTFLSMGMGVIKVTNNSECKGALKTIRSILKRKENKRLGGDSARYLLAEEFIHGTEVALEGIVIDGKLKTLAIFDKPDPLTGPYFVETIYLTPSRFSKPVQDRLMETTQQAIDALGLKTGPVHAELRFNDGGIWLIEIAARSIGGLCSKVLRFQNGASLEEVILRHLLGEDIDGVHREEQAAGVMMIPVSEQGVLKGVRGQTGASMIPEIEEIIISIPPGEEITPLPEGGRYLGFLFARGETPDVVENAIRQAYGFLEIQIE